MEPEVKPRKKHESEGLLPRQGRVKRPVDVESRLQEPPHGRESARRKQPVEPVESLDPCPAQPLLVLGHALQQDGGKDLSEVLVGGHVHGRPAVGVDDARVGPLEEEGADHVLLSQLQRKRGSGSTAHHSDRVTE